MINWDIFYQLLDIGEEVSSPTYYDLLGLTGKNCTAETVAAALAERKKRIRQNIPGPQFIQLILKFEKDYLETAAATLGNADKRRSYDQRLAQEPKPGQKGDLAPRTRVKKTARQLVAAACNADGTLDEDRRPALAEKLYQLGFSLGDVRVLFEGIPTPAVRDDPSNGRKTEFFRKAIDLSQELAFADSSAEQWLLNLAGRLAIPPETAKELMRQHADDQSPTIELMAAPDPGAVIVLDPPAAPSGRVPARPVSTGAEPQNATAISASSEHSPSRLFLWIVLLAVVVMLPAVLLTVFLTSPKASLPHHDTLPTGTTNRNVIGVQPPASIPPASLPKPAQPPAAGEILPPNVGKLSPPASAQPVTPPPPVSSSPAEPSSPAGPTLPDLPVLPLATERTAAIAQGYSQTGRGEDLLADVALTLLAGCDRAGWFVYQDHRWNEELTEILTAGDRTSRIIRDISLSPNTEAADVSSVPAAIGSDTEYLETLRNQLVDKTRAVRYRAIEELRMHHSAQAADILLNALQDKSTTDLATISRILRTLRTFDDSRIPHKLIAILDNPRRIVAQPIVQTLLEENNLRNRSSDECEGVLPFHFTRERLEACMFWWQQFYLQSINTPTWGRNASTAYSPAIAPFNPSQQTVLELTAAAARYALATAQALADFHWEISDFSGRGAGDFSGADVDTGSAEQLLTACEAVTDQCLRLARLHPDAKTHAVALDDIELRRQTDRLLCDTAVQKIAVSLRTTGQLLEILIQLQNSSPPVADLLSRIRKERNRSCDYCPDILVELRHHAYFNLLLWDRLAYAEIQPPAAIGPISPRPQIKPGTINGV